MYKLHSVSTTKTPYLPLNVLTEGFSSPVLLPPVQIAHQSNAHSKSGSPHLSILTVVSSHPSSIDDWTWEGCLHGSHERCQIWTSFPLPILQQAPRLIASRPCKMLFQAYEPRLDSVASIIKQFGKNWGLKILKNKES